MHPNIFTIGRFSIHAYGLFLAIGFIFGILRMYKIAPKYNIDKDHILDLGIYILIAGIIGARLLYVLTNLSKYTLVNSLSIWKGGLSFQGSVVAGIIVAYFYAKSKKMNLWSVLDILCPSVCIGYAFTRIGCFLNGCCYGIESNFPWACKMITDDGIKLCEPVQLYSCVISFIIFYILTKLEFKSNKEGLIFNIYLILYGIYRFLIEFIRHHIDSDYLFFHLSGGQVLALIMILAGLILYYFRFFRNKNSYSNNI